MNNYFVGQSTFMKCVASRHIIDEIARVSSDKNPIHLSESYASNTRFGRCIAHGLFCLGMISALLANELPGEGAILLSQNVSYKRPVFIGDEITASVEITRIEREKRQIELKTICTNQASEIVLDGSVIVMME